jgi:hypothetical protein
VKKKRLPKGAKIKPNKPSNQESFLLVVDKKTKAKARANKAKKRALREKFRKTTIGLTRGEESGRFGRKDQA